MKMNEQNRNLLILLSICVLTIFPLLGLTDYNTKGEPREAIVAYSMLEHGNWILPRNYGGEIAFKPPFLHWSVAAVSTLCGEVSEYSSRVPSALALIIMAAAIYCHVDLFRGTPCRFHLPGRYGIDRFYCVGYYPFLFVV